MKPQCFLELMETLVKKCHENSKAKGFWDEGLRVVVPIDEGKMQEIKTNPWNFAEKIALMHSELSEMLEAHRAGNPPCEKQIKNPITGEMQPLGILEGGKVRTLTSIEEECADVLIRLCDLCGKLGIDLGRVTLAKMEYNAQRPHKHGKAY